MRYRVTQYRQVKQSSLTGWTTEHSKTYRSKLWARWIAWLMAGRGWPDRSTIYRTAIKEES